MGKSSLSFGADGNLYGFHKDVFILSARGHAHRVAELPCEPCWLFFPSRRWERALVAAEKLAIVAKTISMESLTYPEKLPGYLTASDSLNVPCSEEGVQMKLCSVTRHRRITTWKTLITVPLRSEEAEEAPVAARSHITIQSKTQTRAALCTLLGLWSRATLKPCAAFSCRLRASAKPVLGVLRGK